MIDNNKINNKKDKLYPFRMALGATLSGKWEISKRKVLGDIVTEFKVKNKKDSFSLGIHPAIKITQFKVRLHKGCGPKENKNVQNCSSGLKFTKYRLRHNGRWSDWQEGGSFRLSEEGVYYLEYYSEDNLGNCEKINNETILVMRDLHSPGKPTRPDGSTNGKIGVNYTYTTSTVDGDGDQIYYMFDWGDGNTTDWIGPYESGEICEVSHSWSKEGNYNITIIARDEYFCYSEWSDPLPIVMPYSFDVKIENPEHEYLYIFAKKIIPLRGTLIIGPVEIEANANGEANKVEFYIDEELKYTDDEAPYSWLWDEVAMGRHEIKVVAYDFAGNTAMDEQKVWIFNI